MLQFEPIATAPVLDLTPQHLDTIMDELRAYHTIYSPLFQRREQREWSEQYLHGLLLELPRKSIEPMVLTLKGADRNAVRAMQQFLGGGVGMMRPSCAAIGRKLRPIWATTTAC